MGKLALGLLAIALLIALPLQAQSFSIPGNGDPYPVWRDKDTVRIYFIARDEPYACVYRKDVNGYITLLECVQIQGAGAYAVDTGVDPFQPSHMADSGDMYRIDYMGWKTEWKPISNVRPIHSVSLPLVWGKP